MAPRERMSRDPAGGPGVEAKLKSKLEIRRVGEVKI
jgi:hypothetical protein